MLMLHALPSHGGVLREDGDAALALELVRVHHALGHLLVGAEDAGLVQHGVDQRGLAVVDVGDDGDVAEIGTAFRHETAHRAGRAAAGSKGGIGAHRFPSIQARIQARFSAFSFGPNPCPSCSSMRT